MAKVQISAKDLRKLVAPVTPLAEKEHAHTPFPNLAAVHFRTGNGWLVAEATDRFRAGMSRRACDVEDFEALVSVADLRRALALFKPTRHDDPALTLTVSNSAQVCVKGPDASITCGSVPAPFPDLAGLFATAVAAKGAIEHIGLNPQFLADFRHAVGRNEPILVKATSPLKPILVIAGDNFLGLQMPVQSSANADNSVALAVDSWRVLLEPARRDLTNERPGIES